MPTAEAWLSLLPRHKAARLLCVLFGLLSLFFLLGQQGARFGPSLLPRHVPAWLWLVLGAAVAALPRAERPARAGPVAWMAVVLAVVVWPLLTWRARVALPPVALVASVDSLAHPAPRATRVVLPDFGRLRRSPPWRGLIGRSQDFALDIEAWIWAPTATTYHFELRADDAATLALDGSPVIRGASNAAVDVPLARGLHAVSLRHEQGVGAAHLALDWDRPPFVELIPLEGYLAGRPEALARSPLRRRHAATLASLELAWMWWLAAGLLLIRIAELRYAWPSVARREGQARAWLRARWVDPKVRTALLAFAVAACFLGALEAGFRSRARDGLYFQEYTSEYLMQTVSVADLRDQPWRSLFYLHIQPPALDSLRALVAGFHRNEPEPLLLRRVDAGLYAEWVLVYAGLVALVCRWLVLLTSPRYAIVGAAFLSLHPAMLFYATLLDSTLLSAALFCWLCFELWCWPGPRASPTRLAAAAIALFLTRSVFQWPFILVLAASLALRGVAWPKLVRVLGAVALVMAIYTVKQHWLFGLTMTSSFAADSFCKGLQLYCQGTVPVPLPELPPPGRAHVLSRTAKINGEYNYNQLAFLKRSFSQMAEYRDHLRRQPLRTTLAAWRGNLGAYLQPSSRYTPHVIVDRLPWRRLYDAVFSGWPLALLLAAAGAMAFIRGGGGPRTLALVLPCAYVFVVTVIFEGGENMRYKFFIEPVLFVFLATQAYRAIIPEDRPSAGARGARPP